MASAAALTVRAAVSSCCKSCDGFRRGGADLGRAAAGLTHVKERGSDGGGSCDAGRDGVDGGCDDGCCGCVGGCDGGCDGGGGGEVRFVCV